jgi:ElaB/YqjD/DUF883 family membrane-anchored ribosome-binding protein
VTLKIEEDKMTDNTIERSPEEIERDIRSTQEDMSRTVQQIEGELTPRNIFNSLLEKADQNGVNARYVIDVARANPVALGIIALGGLWLVSDVDARPSALGLGKGRSDKLSAGGQSDDIWHPDHRSYVDHMARCEPQDGEDGAAYRRRRDLNRASYFMIEQGHDEDEGTFRQRLDQATDQLRQRRNQASESVQALMEQGRERARQAVSGAKGFYNENPVVSGLAAAFVGAIAGSALPATRIEEEYVGALGEQALTGVKTKAQQVGEDALHRKDDLVERIDQSFATAGASDGGDAGQDNWPRTNANSSAQMQDR